MSKILVAVRKLDERALLPDQAYDGDAGWDLPVLEDITIEPGQWADVRSGLAIATPPGWYCRIVGRSSTWRGRELLVLEGTIDAGFRGELFSTVINPGETPVSVFSGESLAQLTFLPVPGVDWEVVTVLPRSHRGEKGFGSSGR